jgi:hypothetical protein
MAVAARACPEVSIPVAMISMAVCSTNWCSLLRCSTANLSRHPISSFTISTGPATRDRIPFCQLKTFDRYPVTPCPIIRERGIDLSRVRVVDSARLYIDDEVLGRGTTALQQVRVVRGPRTAREARIPVHREPREVPLPDQEEA